MDSSREQQCREYRIHDTAWELLRISMLLEKGTTPELRLFKVVPISFSMILSFDNMYPDQGYLGNSNYTVILNYI